MTATEKIYDPDWRDRLFQRWHGIDVEGILPVEVIASPDLAQSSRGTFYQPIPLRFLKVYPFAILLIWDAARVRLVFSWHGRGLFAGLSAWIFQRIC